jgi:transposase
MFVDDSKYTRNGKTYRRVLLRTGKRVNGKVKLETIANISDCSDQEIQAIKIALKNSDDLVKVAKLADFESYAGKIFSIVYLLNEVGKKIGLHDIFGKSEDGLLCLWLVFARLIDQGSRLSAVRLANIHAGCEVLGISKLNENLLYKSLDWLFIHKQEMETRTFENWQKHNKGTHSRNVFLYDVTSSYLEGNQNELAAFGYNRDKKKGKKILVYGLLTDSDGDPLGVEVFPGNTTDNKTVSRQIDKIKTKYNAKYVTLVGDKGMIKSDQIQELQNNNFQYITTITKPQIESLIKKGTFQLELFDENLFEIQLPQEQGNEQGEKTTRYILRRNPVRALEMKKNYYSKIAACRKKLYKSNTYLQEHSRASVSVQLRDINNWLIKMKIDKFVVVYPDLKNQRNIKLIVDYQQLAECSKLDGCYVIKTDLPQHVINKEAVHSRYKDLAEVEQAFKVSKSILDARPIYLRKKERTMAHLMICMYSYKIRRRLVKAWGTIDLTVEEIFETLKQIGSDVLEIGKIPRALISRPNSICSRILSLADVELPKVIDFVTADVNTTKKLPPCRK